MTCPRAHEASGRARHCHGLLIPALPGALGTIVLNIHGRE